MFKNKKMMVYHKAINNKKNFIIIKQGEYIFSKLNNEFTVLNKIYSIPFIIYKNKKRIVINDNPFYFIKNNLENLEEIRNSNVEKIKLDNRRCGRI